MITFSGDLNVFSFIVFEIVVCRLKMSQKRIHQKVESGAMKELKIWNIFSSHGFYQNPQLHPKLQKLFGYKLQEIIFIIKQ